MTDDEVRAALSAGRSPSGCTRSKSGWSAIFTGYGPPPWRLASSTSAGRRRAPMWRRAANRQRRRRGAAGLSDRAGRRRRARAAAACHDDVPPQGPGGVDREPGQSADRARDGEPHLAVPFRRRAGATPSDFGIRAGQPSHPELLDWLAMEFVGAGGRSSDAPADHDIAGVPAQLRPCPKRRAQKDPDERSALPLHAPPLSAEEIRDAVLQAAGALNLKMGGVAGRAAARARGAAAASSASRTAPGW